MVRQAFAAARREISERCARVRCFFAGLTDLDADLTDFLDLLIWIFSFLLVELFAAHSI